MVSEKAVEVAWMALTGRDMAGPAYAADWACMMECERKQVRAALEVALPVMLGEAVAEMMPEFMHGHVRWLVDKESIPPGTKLYALAAMGATQQGEARVGAHGTPAWMAEVLRGAASHIELRGQKSYVEHLKAIASYIESTPPPPAQQPAHGVPEGMVLVRRDDLESLAGTDFGKGYWNNRAELAAMRVRALLAAAQQPEKE